MPKVLDSSTVTTPSLPTLSMALAMSLTDLGVGGGDGGDLGDLAPWTRLDFLEMALMEATARLDRSLVDAPS